MLPLRAPAFIDLKPRLYRPPLAKTQPKALAFVVICLLKS